MQNIFLIFVAFLCVSASAQLFPERADLTAGDNAVSYASGVFCDITNDGYPELVIPNSAAAGPRTLMWTGTRLQDWTDFTNIWVPVLPNYPWGGPALCQDINQDGNMDLVFMSFETNPHAVILYGPVPFTIFQTIAMWSGIPPTPIMPYTGTNGHPFLGAIVDLNCDGYIDFIADQKNRGITFQQNLGGLSFQYNASFGGLVQWSGEGDYGGIADISNDHYTDIVTRQWSGFYDTWISIPNMDGSVSSFNVSDNVLSNHFLGEYGGICFGDFWKRGKLDIVSSGGSKHTGFDQPGLYRSDNDGATWYRVFINTDFESGNREYANAVACEDVNNDGYPDILMSSKDRMRVYVNNLVAANNFLTDSAQASSNRNPYGGGIIVGDVDGDGDQDVIVTRTGKKPRVYKNSFTSCTSMTVTSKTFDHMNPPLDYICTNECTGMRVYVKDESGAVLVNARVGLYNGTGDLIAGIRETHGGWSHGSQPYSRLHFGLGSFDPSTEPFYITVYPSCGLQASMKAYCPGDVSCMSLSTYDIEYTHLSDMQPHLTGGLCDILPDHFVMNDWRVAQDFDVLANDGLIYNTPLATANLRVSLLCDNLPCDNPSWGTVSISAKKKRASGDLVTVTPGTGAPPKNLYFTYQVCHLYIPNCCQIANVTIDITPPCTLMPEVCTAFASTCGTGACDAGNITSDNWGCIYNASFTGDLEPECTINGYPCAAGFCHPDGYCSSKVNLNDAMCYVDRCRVGVCDPFNITEQVDPVTGCGGVYADGTPCKELSANLSMTTPCYGNATCQAGVCVRETLDHSACVDEYVCWERGVCGGNSDYWFLRPIAYIGQEGGDRFDNQAPANSAPLGFDQLYTMSSIQEDRFGYRVVYLGTDVIVADQDAFRRITQVAIFFGDTFWAVDQNLPGVVYILRNALENQPRFKNVDMLYIRSTDLPAADQVLFNDTIGVNTSPNYLETNIYTWWKSCAGLDAWYDAENDKQWVACLGTTLYSVASKYQINDHLDLGFPISLVIWEREPVNGTYSINSVLTWASGTMMLQFVLPSIYDVANYLSPIKPDSLKGYNGVLITHMSISVAGLQPGWDIGVAANSSDQCQWWTTYRYNATLNSWYEASYYNDTGNCFAFPQNLPYNSNHYPGMASPNEFDDMADILAALQPSVDKTIGIAAHIIANHDIEPGTLPMMGIWDLNTDPPSIVQKLTIGDSLPVDTTDLRNMTKMISCAGDGFLVVARMCSLENRTSIDCLWVYKWDGSQYTNEQQLTTPDRDYFTQAIAVHRYWSCAVDSNRIVAIFNREYSLVEPPDTPPASGGDANRNYKWSWVEYYHRTSFFADDNNHYGFVGAKQLDSPYGNDTYYNTNPGTIYSSYWGTQITLGEGVDYQFAFVGIPMDYDGSRNWGQGLVAVICLDFQDGCVKGCDVWHKPYYFRDSPENTPCVPHLVSQCFADTAYCYRGDCRIDATDRFCEANVTATSPSCRLDWCSTYADCVSLIAPTGLRCNEDGNSPCDVDATCERWVCDREMGGVCTYDTLLTSGQCINATNGCYVGTCDGGGNFCPNQVYTPSRCSGLGNAPGATVFTAKYNLSCPTNSSQILGYNGCVETCIYDYQTAAIYGYPVECPFSPGCAYDPNCPTKLLNNDYLCSNATECSYLTPRECVDPGCVGGVCVYIPKTLGTVCNMTGISANITCTGTAGTCDGQGSCVPDVFTQPAKSCVDVCGDSACNDGLWYTTNDVCTSGYHCKGIPDAIVIGPQYGFIGFSIVDAIPDFMAQNITYEEDCLYPFECGYGNAQLNPCGFYCAWSSYVPSGLNPANDEVRCGHDICNLGTRGICSNTTFDCLATPGAINPLCSDPGCYKLIVIAIDTSDTLSFAEKVTVLNALTTTLVTLLEGTFATVALIPYAGYAYPACSYNNFDNPTGIAAFIDCANNMFADNVTFSQISSRRCWPSALALAANSIKAPDLLILFSTGIPSRCGNSSLWIKENRDRGTVIRGICTSLDPDDCNDFILHLGSRNVDWLYTPTVSTFAQALASIINREDVTGCEPYMPPCQTAVIDNSTCACSIYNDPAAMGDPCNEGVPCVIDGICDDMGNCLPDTLESDGSVCYPRSQTNCAYGTCSSGACSINSISKTCEHITARDDCTFQFTVPVPEGTQLDVLGNDDGPYDPATLTNTSVPVPLVNLTVVNGKFLITDIPTLMNINVTFNYSVCGYNASFCDQATVCVYIEVPVTCYTQMDPDLYCMQFTNSCISSVICDAYSYSADYVDPVTFCAYFYEPPGTQCDTPTDECTDYQCSGVQCLAVDNPTLCPGILCYNVSACVGGFCEYENMTTEETICDNGIMDGKDICLGGNCTNVLNCTNDEVSFGPYDTVVVIDLSTNDFGADYCDIDLTGTPFILTQSPAGNCTIQLERPECDFANYTLSYNATNTVYNLTCPCNITATTLTPTSVYALDDSGMTNVGGTITIDVSVNDSPNSDKSTIELTACPGMSQCNYTWGNVTILGNYNLFVELLPSISCNVSFMYTICDNTTCLNCANATVVIDIYPLAVNDMVTVITPNNATVNVTDNDLGAITSCTAPTPFDLPVNWTFTFLPYPDCRMIVTPYNCSFGSFVTNYTICTCDDVVLCDTGFVTITVEMFTDVVTNPDTVYVDSGGSMLIDVLANDVGPVHTETLEFADCPGNTTCYFPWGSATILANYTILVNASATVSCNYTFMYKICDNTPCAAVSGETVTVVISPVAIADTGGSISSNPTIIDIIANDLGNITFCSSPVPFDLPLGWIYAISPFPNCSITITPAACEYGVVNSNYTICGCDDFSLCSTSTITVTIDPPPGITTLPDSVDVVYQSSAEVDVLANDSANVDPFTLELDACPAQLSCTYTWGTVNITVNNTLIVNAFGTFLCDQTFNYTVCDNQGCGLCNSEIVTVNIYPDAIDDSASAISPSSVVVTPLANDLGTITSCDFPVPIDLPPGWNYTVAPYPSCNITLSSPSCQYGSIIANYTICSCSGSVLCDTAYLNLTIEMPAHVTTYDDVIITENGASTIENVLANDGPGLDNSTIELVACPMMTTCVYSWGSVTILPDYTLQVNVSTTLSCNQTFEYSVCDGLSCLNCMMSVVTVVISPVAFNDTGIATTPDGVIIDVLANDWGDIASCNSSAPFDLPFGWNYTMEPYPNCSISLVPVACEIGTVNSNYTICSCNDSSLCSTAFVTINIIDREPVIAVDDITVTENGGTTVLDIAANDSGNSDPSTIELVDCPAALYCNYTWGSVTILPNFTLQIDVLLTQSCNQTFDYMICDSSPCSICDNATVTVVIYPVSVDDSFSSITPDSVSGFPLLNDLGNITSCDFPVPYDLPANWTYTTSPYPSCNFTLIPASCEVGNITANYTVCSCDDFSLCSTSFIYLSVLPRPIIFADNDTLITENGETVMLDVLPNDIGDIDPSTIELDACPGMSMCDYGWGIVTIQLDFMLFINISTDVSCYQQFTYTVCDNSTCNNCATAYVDIEIYPVAFADIGLSISPDNATVDVLANDLGNITSCSSSPPVGLPANWTYTMAPFPDCQATLSPAPCGYGDYMTNYTICACDDFSLCAYASIIFMILPRPIVAAGDDQFYAITGDVITVNVTTNDSSNIDVSTIELTACPAASFCDYDWGRVTILPNYNLEINITLGFSCNVTFEYSICDGSGCGICDTANVTVTIFPIVENDSASAMIPYSVSVSPLDNDIGNITGCASPTPFDIPAGWIYSIEPFPNCSITLVPAECEYGTVLSNYTACTCPDLSICVVAYVNLTIEPLVPLTASPDLVITTNAASEIVSVVDNDSVDADPSTIELVACPGMSFCSFSWGNVTILGNFSLRIDVGTLESCNQTFFYTVCDNTTCGNCATTSVVVEIYPVPVDDAYSAVTPESAVGFPLDNDIGNITSCSFPTPFDLPANWTLVGGAFPNCNVTLIPAACETGNITTNYTICSCDDFSLCSTGNIDFSILPRPPILPQPDMMTTQSGAIFLLDVLSNDLGDIDPSTIDFVACPGMPSCDYGWGVVTIQPNNTLLFNISSTESCYQTLTYIVCDNSTCNNCGQAVVNITIYPAAASDFGISTTPNNVTIDILANDYGNITFCSSPPPDNLPTNWTYSILPFPDCSVILDPQNCEYGNFSTNYTICTCDGGELCDLANIELVVLPRDPVTAQDDAYNAVTGDVFNVNVTQNDSANVDPSTIELTDCPAALFCDYYWGRVTILPNYTLQVNITINVTCNVTFEYQVCDSSICNICDTANATISVYPIANDDSASTTTPNSVSVVPIDNDIGVLSYCDSPVPVDLPPGWSYSIQPYPNCSIELIPVPCQYGVVLSNYTICSCPDFSLCVTANVNLTIEMIVNVTTNDDVVYLQNGGSVIQNVLTNDSMNVDPTTIQISSCPGMSFCSFPWGSVEILPDYSFQINATCDLSCNQTFYYTVCDSTVCDNCMMGIVTVIISPVAYDDSAVSIVSDVITVDVLENDCSGPPNYCNVTTPVGFPGGWVIDILPAPNCSVVVTPSTCDLFNMTSLYTICSCADSSLCSAANVSIQFVDPPPIQPMDDVAFSESGGSSYLDVLFNDLGTIDNSSLELSNCPGASYCEYPWGNVTLLGNNTLQIDVFYNSSCNKTFEYTVCSTYVCGLCENATVTVVITPVAVNDSALAITPNTAYVEALLNDGGEITSCLSPSPELLPAGWSYFMEPYPNCTAYLVPAACEYGSLETNYTVCTCGEEIYCSTAFIYFEILEPPSFSLVDDSLETMNNQTELLDVLANDNIAINTTHLELAACPNMSSCVYTWGTVEILPNNTLQINISTTISCNVSFIYTVCDDAPCGVCMNATVSITIYPIAMPDSAIVIFPDSIDSFDIVSNDVGSIASCYSPTPYDLPIGWSYIVGASPNCNITLIHAVCEFGTVFANYTICACPNDTICSTAPIMLNILEPEPFVVEDDVAITESGGVVIVDVVANDPPDTNRTTLELEACPGMNLCSYPWGDVTITANGTLQINANFNSSCNQTFNYIVCDNTTCGYCDVGQVVVVIYPVAVNDSIQIPISTNGTIIVTENDGGNITSCTSPSPYDLPAGWTYTFNTSDCSVTLVPAICETGTLVANYTICTCDGTYLCSTANILFEVLDGPMVNALNDGSMVQSNQSVVIDVLYNDLGTKEPSTVQVTSGPTYGSISSINPTTGEITYQAPDNFTGMDYFTYQVCESVNMCSCDEANVTVVVYQTIGNYMVMDDCFEGFANITTTGLPLLNDGPPNADPNTFVILDGGLDGMSSFNNATMEFVFIPFDPFFFGTTHITYVVCSSMDMSFCDIADIKVYIIPFIFEIEPGDCGNDRLTLVDLPYKGPCI